MPSLLVTKKMSPELAARVQASVEGKRARPGARVTPRIMGLVRLAMFGMMILVVVWLFVAFRRVQRELESQRGQLLERVRAASASLTPDDHEAPRRLLPWLDGSSGTYEGDLVSHELTPPGAFARLLARPTVYVRGPLSSFGGGARAKESASTSFKDAFVLCLNSPPPMRTEKLLRAKARAAYPGRGEGMKPTEHVNRLFDALVGLPYLGPEWERRVVDAKSAEELTTLQKDFDRVPVKGAKEAARAELFVFVMDEQSDKRGPTELDGERPHDVRVHLVDLKKQRVLLRIRRRVDPSWVSAATRAEFATGIDSCALALDVHSAVTGVREVAAGSASSP
jgi:hypothetical protein